MRLTEKFSNIRRLPIVPLTILVAVIVVALFAPLIAPHPPTESALGDRMLPPAWMKGGHSEYLLGTDTLGRGCFPKKVTQEILD